MSAGGRVGAPSRNDSDYASVKRSPRGTQGDEEAAKVREEKRETAAVPENARVPSRQDSDYASIRRGASQVAAAEEEEGRASRGQVGTAPATARSRGSSRRESQKPAVVETPVGRTISSSERKVKSEEGGASSSRGLSRPSDARTTASSRSTSFAKKREEDNEKRQKKKTHRSSSGQGRRPVNGRPFASREPGAPDGRGDGGATEVKKSPGRRGLSAEYQRDGSPKRYPAPSRRFDPADPSEQNKRVVSDDPIEQHISDIRSWLEAMRGHRSGQRAVRTRSEWPPQSAQPKEISKEEKGRRSASQREGKRKKEKKPLPAMTTTVTDSSSAITDSALISSAAVSRSDRAPHRRRRKAADRSADYSKGSQSLEADAGFPALHFTSFLDGTTFSSTDELCDYNTSVAQALTDSDLAVVRHTVFNHDEVYFAELLYGDGIAEELQDLENSAKRSPMSPQLLFEMRMAAVNRFNAKCVAAHTALLTFGGAVNDAIQREGMKAMAARATELTTTIR